MIEKRRTGATFALAGSALLAACVGQIGSVSGGDGPSGDAGADGGNRGSAAVIPEGFTASPTSMRRLTTFEFTNAIQDLTGHVPTSAVEAIDYHSYDFSTVGSGLVSISENGVEQFDTAAQTVAHTIFANATGAAAFVGCSPQSATNPCIATFLHRFGRLAWRRALTDAEVTRYATLVSANAAPLNGVMTALEYVTAAFLASPNFLYRAEVGEANPATVGLQRFSGYDLAARLAFLLQGTTPDDALLAAAESGSLVTTAGVEAQATRLLASPRAQAALLHFFGEHFGLDLLDTLTKDPTTYPLFTPTLGASMRGEIERDLASIIFTQNTDFRALFDARSSYVNGELAALYGVTPPAGDGFSQVTWPAEGDRAGIFGFAGMLAVQAHEVLTSPTLRGKFLRERLFCTPIAPPPANVANGRFAGTPTGAHQTMREQLQAHMADPSCSGCHVQMDPIGFGLEHFDAIGAYRANDQGLTLDTATDLDGKPFDGPAQLGALLRDDPRTSSCLVTKFYTYATGHAPLAGEKPILDALNTSFQSSGYRLLSLVTETVKSAGFRYTLAPK